MNGFSCRVRRAGDPVVVEVAGDIDLATRDELLKTAADALTPGAGLVIDCSGIRFMDSMGLSALLELQRRVADAGGAFSLAAVAAPVLTVLELSGTADQFVIIDGPPGAGDGAPEPRTVRARGAVEHVPELELPT